jgi:two-component system sensor histidine kinase UhpB
MPLRSRLLISVACAMLAGMAFGCLLTVWQARSSIATEVDAALAVGRQTVSAALVDLAESADRRRDLLRIIAIFDGNRHIRASLVGRDGVRLAQSTVAPVDGNVPDWFSRAIGVRSAQAIIPLGRVDDLEREIALETDPRNEVAEVWTSLGNTMLVIVTLCTVVGLSMWWAIVRALQPLAAFSHALQSVGAGRFEARLEGGRLPETQIIATAFNRMAADLAQARQRNLALYRQLITTQEAERGEIARDLHDEIGPLLFAINLDAAAIEAGTSAIERDGIRSGARAIHETVQQLHLRLRAIVNRLRPLGLAELGLGLRPEVQFRLDLPEPLPAMDGHCEITLYRLVQEALSNALRHGDPRSVAITVRIDEDQPSRIRVAVEDDGTGTARIEPGLGLLGMQERVEAAGGVLALTAAPNLGFRVQAALPLDVAPAAPPVQPLAAIHAGVS